MLKSVDSFIAVSRHSAGRFAAWSNVLMLAVIFVFGIYGAMAAAALDQAPVEPVVFGVIGLGLLLGVGVPITVGDQVIGAVGVAGGSPDQDHQIAAAGAAALESAL